MYYVIVNCCEVKSKKKTALFGLRDDFSTNSMINALFFSFWEHYVVYTNAAHCMSRYFLHKLNIGMPGYSRNLLAIFFHNGFFVMKNSYRNSIVISELWSNQVRCSKFVFVWSKLKVSAIEFLKFGNFDPTLSSNCQRSEWTSKKYLLYLLLFISRMINQLFFEIVLLPKPL